MRLILALVAAVVMSVAPAAAQFDAPTNCEKFRGEWICEDPVGESEHSGGNSETVTETSRGNLTNKRECSGPGSSDSGC
jgi:hypothetical protein